ncbi:MAG: MOSC N-terminal beta barrel domain-containing protein [Planctomycetota bacterium]|nr:MOSC N-terminal beta barrel domain-containing protein [Planctomycetota bacterium]
MPYLSAIYLYPIKALDPVSVREAKILESGALDFDREFAMLDAGGKFINGKRNPKIHRLRAHTYPETGLVAFQSPDTDEMPVFHLEEQKGEAEAWLSKFFEQPVTLQQNAAGGFPDDRKANGPTLIGRETLKEVASWYEGLTEESTRLRFRANLELGGALPFWEDRLFADPGYVVRFTIGDVRVDGIQPCARCIVPTRDPFTGKPRRTSRDASASTARRPCPRSLPSRASTTTIASRSIRRSASRKPGSSLRWACA